MNRIKQQSGFTLIEMLVGVVLFVITATVVTTLIINSGEQTQKTMSVTQQNSQLRAAMEQIRGDLAQAQSYQAGGSLPLDNGNQGANSIQFVRAVDDGAGGTEFLVERIAFNGGDATNPAHKYTITVQQTERRGSPDDAALRNPTFGPARVLIDNVLASNEEPIFRYFETAVKPLKVGEGLPHEVAQLVDLTLKRDMDLDTSSTNTSAAYTAAENDKLNPTAKVITSIYLTGTATQGRSGEDDQLSC